eukprot:jgi/Chrzof1/13833/Cz08g14080.t1
MPSMQAPTTPASKTLQCKCAGILPHSTGHNALFDILRGMCTRYETFRSWEIGYRVPLQGGLEHNSIKLVRKEEPPTKATHLGPAPPHVWRMIHEGSPALGPQYKDLPATVREISRSTLFGKHAHNFVASLGAQTEFQLQRSGNLYICTHQGYEVEVSIHTIRSTVAPYTDFTPGFLLVEVTAAADDSNKFEVAKALGSFAERLLPLARLLPA